MPDTVKLSILEARRAAVRAQGLDGPRIKGETSRAAALAAIEHLGYIQIDTISVIARAHEHTFFNRVDGYRPADLAELQESRQVFEYWAHAAAYLPMTDYRFHLPEMERHRLGGTMWSERHEEIARSVMPEVLARIRTEGELGSKDFEKPDGVKTGAWWGWKPAKVALEMLFWRGELMIAGRKNFQRLYDLPERVLPDWVNTAMPDEGELGRFMVRRALKAHGLATLREMKDHIKVADRKVTIAGLNHLLEAGEVIEVEIEGLNNEATYALAGTLEKLTQPVGGEMRLLSPFDNLVIQRARMKRLFDFDYTIECYTPPAKRVYGYFSLPILWGDRLIGRLDAKADRKQKTLLVQSLYFEPEFDSVMESLPALADTLWDFARFNQCRQVTLVKVERDEVRAPLEKLLARTVL